MPDVPSVPLDPDVPDVIALKATPSIYKLPLVMFTEPLINNEPVNSCVSSIVFPNFVEPEVYTTEEL